MVTIQRKYLTTRERQILKGAKIMAEVERCQPNLKLY